jgi:putative DNA primase/helicase
VRDGILDIRTDEILPFSPKYIITNKADWSYNPSAYHELMDTTLNKICCGHSDLRMLIEEMIGYTLYRKNTMQSAFILTGEGSNGKSTFLNLIKKLLGKENYTSLELQDLEDQYKPADMHNKLANIGDDISSKYMENSSIFKKVVTGESFVVRKIYQEPFEMSCYATQIFCANTLPQVNDKSDGFTRRLIIVPFNAKFSKSDEDYNPFIEEDLSTEEAMEYLFKIAIDGLKRLLVNREFTKSEVGEREKQSYLIYNDNVLEYLSEDPKIDNESIADVYTRYTVWCANNGVHPVKKIGFSKSIQKHAGYTSTTNYMDGKSVKIYKKG